MSRSVPAILILEADEATRELYRRELGRSYRVLACRSEHEASSLLQMEPIDVLIVEPTTLSDDGWSFLARVRAMPAYSQTPIVLCSTLDARRRGGEMGVAAYLVKPVTPLTLRSTVEAVMQQAAVYTHDAD